MLPVPRSFSTSSDLPVPMSDVRGRARLVIAFLAIQSLGFLVYLVANLGASGPERSRVLLQTAYGWLACLLLAAAARRGWVKTASLGYLGCGWLFLALSGWTGGGMRGPVPLGLLVLIVAGGLLLGTLGSVVMAGTCLATGLGLALAEASGRLPHSAVRHGPLENSTDFAVYVLLTVSFQLLAVRTLRASESRYRLLVERAGDLIFTVTREGTLTSLNPAFERLTGERASAWIGRDLAGLVATDEGLAQWQAGRDAHAAAFELPLRAQERTVTVELVLAPAADGSGDLLGVGRDVTERRQAENRRAQFDAQLRQAQKREAIGTLASGIAHDFNNVLTAISGHAQLIGDSAPDVTSRGRALEILRASGRARDVVRQLLTFARSTGQPHRAVPLGDVVREAVQLLRASIPAAIALDLVVPQGELVISADPGQIHQVVINLVSNAAQAIGARPGRIEIAVERAVESAASGAADALARLRVTDTGEGIDPALRERIFEPFFTTRPQGEGTGLGLAVVQGIVQDHAGTIAVRGAPGGGTIFEVDLPLARGATMGVPETSAPVPRGRGERVLLVDDETAVLRVMREQLERLGYTVTAAQQSEDALELLAEEPDEFDVVVTDLQMPRMDGLELAARMAAVRPGLPVVLATGNRWAIPMPAAQAAGIVEVLDKPFGLGDLARAVRSALDSRRQATDRRSA